MVKGMNVLKDRECLGVVQIEQPEMETLRVVAIVKADSLVTSPNEHCPDPEMEGAKTKAYALGKLSLHPTLDLEKSQKMTEG